jgi:hypothetical protein
MRYCIVICLLLIGCQTKPRLPDGFGYGQDERGHYWVWKEWPEYRSIWRHDTKEQAWLDAWAFIHAYNESKRP